MARQGKGRCGNVFGKVLEGEGGDTVRRGGAERGLRGGEEEAEWGMKGWQGAGSEVKVRECVGERGAARASSTQFSNRSCVPSVGECERCVGVGVGVGRAACSHSRRDLCIIVKGVWESIDHAAVSLKGHPQTGAGGCDTPTIITIAGYWLECVYHHHYRITNHVGTIA